MLDEAVGPTFDACVLSRRLGPFIERPYCVIVTACVSVYQLLCQFFSQERRGL